MRRFVPPGSTVALGTCLEQMIPFAATHALIRARIGELTLVGPVSDICFDQLIGAGLARAMAAWVGNVMMGSAYAFRRAAERAAPRSLEVVDFSNFTLALALHAAAIGAPFLPTQRARRRVGGSEPLAPRRRGSRERRTRPGVRPLAPDVAIIHAQRADPRQRCAVGKPRDHARRGARRARGDRHGRGDREPGPIRSDPNRVVVPGMLVAAVARRAGARTPPPCRATTAATTKPMPTTTRGRGRRRDSMRGGRSGGRRRGLEGYVARVGNERIHALIPTEHRFAEPVDYGY